MAYIIIPRRVACRSEQPADSDWEKPKDWKFMEMSGEVLDNLPSTWRQYPDTAAGRMSIIDMEYKELHDARRDEDVSHELVHLASACLHLWRRINNAE